MTTATPTEASAPRRLQGGIREAAAPHAQLLLESISHSSKILRNEPPPNFPARKRINSRIVFFPSVCSSRTLVDLPPKLNLRCPRHAGFFLVDRPNHLALPHLRKTRRRGHGRGLQSRGHQPSPLRGPEISSR